MRTPKFEAAKLEPIAKAVDLAAAQQRIHELERKIGQQQLELDFFQKALRRVERSRTDSNVVSFRAGIGVILEAP